MATRAISKLNILIGATTVGLQQGLRTAKGMVSEFDTRMERTFGAARYRGIRSAFTGLAAAIAIGTAATAGLAMAFNETRQEVDELAKDARALGFTFHEFASLGLAAEKSGTSIAELNRGMSRLSDTLAEARDGSGRAQMAFERLGLDTEDLFSSSPAEALEAVAVQLTEVENRFQRIQIARELFGRAGDKLILLLDEVAEGMEKIKQEREALGADPNFNTSAIEDMNDALTRMDTAVEIAKQEWTEFFSPVVQEQAENMTNFLAMINKLSNQMEGSEGPTWIQELVGSTIMPLGNVLSDLSELLGLDAGAAPEDPIGLDVSRENAEATLDAVRSMQALSPVDIRTGEGQREVGRLIRASII